MKATIKLPNGTVIDVEEGTPEEIRRLAEQPAPPITITVQPHQPIPPFVWPTPINPWAWPGVVIGKDSFMGGTFDMQMEQQGQGYLPVMCNAEGMARSPATYRFENRADPRAKCLTTSAATASLH